MKIVCIGTSLTAGSFERFELDIKASYPSQLERMLRERHPELDIIVVNSGIGGDTITNGDKRFQSDVLDHSPNLVVINYGGANDTTHTPIGKYAECLERMFIRLKERNIPVIFMTDNMMATRYIADDDDTEFITELKKKQVALFEAGSVLKMQFHEVYFDICAKYGVPVCDIFRYWEKLYKSGVDITELLAQHVTHPNREMVKRHAQLLLPYIEFELRI